MSNEELDPVEVAGLDQVGAGNYTLRKTESKKYNIKYLGDSFSGPVVVLKNNERAWIRIIEGGGNWFQTSAVRSCTPTRTGFLIETENSFYELNRIESGTGTE